MEMNIGTQVRLKPSIPDSFLGRGCAAIDRPVNKSPDAATLPGSPGMCWHSPSTVVRVFADGGLLLENAHHYVRQAEPTAVELDGFGVDWEVLAVPAPPALRLVYSDLPPREYSPNSRCSWPTRYNAGARAVGDVIALVKEQGWAGVPLVGPVVKITWGLPTRGAIDWDNLVARTKPLVDGLVAAKVLAGDSVRDYQPAYHWEASPKHPYTLIEVIEREASDD